VGKGIQILHIKNCKYQEKVISLSSTFTHMQYSAALYANFAIVSVFDA